MNWKGTKGNWVAKGNTVSKGGEKIRQICGAEGACMHTMKANQERRLADAQLIANAGNTIQECDLLPSEILEQRNELLKAFKVLLSSNSSRQKNNLIPSDILTIKQAINKAEQ